MYIVLACVLLASASAFVCPPNYCDTVKQEPLNCVGSVLPNAGYCGCTNTCAKQAGEACQAATSLLGRQSLGTCDDGLVCVPYGEMVMLGYGRCHTKTSRNARFVSTSGLNTECEQQRRARLMSMVVWQGQWVPVCDSLGNFVPHQCDNMHQCFCVDPVKGTMLTQKTLGAVDCSSN